MANNKRRCLKIGLLNARSLNTGQDELFATFENYRPDILAINETWLPDGQENLAPAIPNYIFLHKARKNKKGGGVGFYVRQGIKIRTLRHPSSHLEQLWIEVQLPGAKIAIGTAYRPESTSLRETWDSLSESMSSIARCDYICLLGDLNVDLLKVNSARAKEFLDFCHHHSMEQLVKEATRITDESETLIDIIMTSKELKCNKVSVVHNKSLSDHATILADLQVAKPNIVNRIRFSRNLLDINLSIFEQDLYSLDWKAILNNQDVNCMVDLLNNYILSIFDKHAPIKRKIIKAAPKPWITNMIRFMISLRNEAQVKAQKEKTQSSKEYYRSLKNFVTSSIEREKKAYFNYFLNNNLDKPKELWKNIRKTSLYDNQIATEIPDCLNDPEKINEHFLKLPVEENVKSDQKVTVLMHTDDNSQGFRLKPTTEDEVRKIINNIKTNAAGHDTLTIEMLKLTLDITLPIIVAIINRSIETSTFPSAWKTALVRPIPKKKTIENFSDLRPVSILPALSKVMEKVVLKQIECYFHEKNIIPRLQSGFRKGHGTETALLHVTDELTEASDKGLSSIIVLLDYSRAFDCLRSDLLLAKLLHYGFSSDTCQWFRTFLTNREQMVVLNSPNGEIKSSKTRKLIRGVPQGSILSPLLFSIFTADLPSHIKTCNYHLYADDTQIYYSFSGKNVKEAINKINLDLGNIYKWSIDNSLVLNPSKSKMIIMGTRHQIREVINSNEKININNIVIEPVSHARNLGLIIDGEQKYEKHVNEKIKNAFFKLKQLYRIRPYIKEELRMQLVDLLVLSPFNYCDSVYGPRINNNTAMAIQRVQNACLRFCFNIPRRKHVTPYMNAKGIINMSARRELHYACLTQRVIWSKCPDYLFEKLTWKRDFSRSNLRSVSSNMLQIPAHKSTRFKGCFKLQASKIWNDLPPPLRIKMTVQSFKLKYKFALQKKQCATENLKHPYHKDITLRAFFS